MATRTWVGGAVETAQVTEWTFGGSWISGETITIAYGQKTWTYTTASGVIATFLAALDTAYDALSSTTYPEYAEQTASSTSTKLILTADTAGKPFTATFSTNSASGTISAASTTTSNSGPNAWVAANFSGSTLPTGGDTVIIDRDGTEIFHGLDQSGVTLANLTVLANDSKIGLPRVNSDGTEYPEYRDQHLKVGATDCILDSDSGRLKVNFGSVQTACRVLNSGTGDETDVPAVLLLGTHASNTVEVARGEVGIAFHGGEASTVLTLYVGQEDSPASDARVTCGSGTTLGTITKSGGVLVVNSAIGTALTQLSGVTVVNGTGAVASISGQGGRIVYSTAGTLNGSPVLTNGCVLDFSQDLRAKTVTNPIDCFDTANVFDPHKVVGTLIIDYNQTTGGMGIGKNIRVTRGTPA